MKRLFFGAIALLILLVACGGEPTTPDLSQQPPRLRVTVSEALVFSQPVRESEILFRLIAGDELPIVAKTVPDLIGVAWYQVGRGAEFGWIAGSQVEVTGNVDLVRTVDESIWQAPTETPLPVMPAGVLSAVVQAGGAAVLDTPAADAPVNLQLDPDEQVDVLGRVAGFFLVGQDGAVLGWVVQESLQLNGELAAVPVLEEEANAPVSQAASAIPTRTPPPSSTPPNLASTTERLPSATPPPATNTPAPSSTPSLRQGTPPPLALTLPDGWQGVDLFVPLNTIYIQGELPVSIYQGELEGDILGTMWIVWGFPNVTSPTGGVNLYADGVQLLRGFIFNGLECNIGLADERRQTKVGTFDAIGTIYSAVDCPDSADIAGFFALLQHPDYGNFAFFVGVEPVTATDAGLPQMQAILDSVQFNPLED